MSWVAALVHLIILFLSFFSFIFFFNSDVKKHRVVKPDVGKVYVEEFYIFSQTLSVFKYDKQEENKYQKIKRIWWSKQSPTLSSFVFFISLIFSFVRDYWTLTSFTQICFPLYSPLTKYPNPSICALPSLILHYFPLIFLLSPNSLPLTFFSFHSFTNTSPIQYLCVADMAFNG